MANELLPGGITEAQLALWKKEHKKIHQFDVIVDEEGKDVATAYFKSPDINTLAAAMQVVDSDPMQANKILFANTWLGGDERIQTDDELKFSVYVKLVRIVKLRTVNIKNL